MDEKVAIALESQNPWWSSREFATGIDRLSSFPQIERYMNAQEVVLIVGARRTGKSTLVYQIIRSLLDQGVDKQAILYINLDEPLFLSMADDPTLLSAIVEEHLARHGSGERLYLCIDEIQNYAYWAPAIKTLYDTKSNIKCILTGSVSTLLRQEMSTRLSGRHLSINVYPLTFPECLGFQKIQDPTIMEKRKVFGEYLKYGGFPRVVLEFDETMKMEILKNYYETIYLKDIIFPNKIRKNREIIDLLYYLVSHTGTLLSFNKIADTLQISTDTVQEYIEYAENAFLLSTLMKYDYSLKKQRTNPKKIYAVDPGLINAVSFAFSENRGRLIENVIHMALKRVYEEIYYHKGTYECDFVVRSGRRITHAFQVTQSLRDPKNREREIRGLVEAMETFHLSEGTIITEYESEKIDREGRVIHVVPSYAWLSRNDQPL
ncbi:ATPase (AAA+ superfamily) [Methanocalculus chunghsingensis]|uniref:ATPase (AAA+ superfamily) n=1 Tax=Methanocalculus chunghsingensis TaxID=156457 RepID=A0A8J8B679_9EURY|nr:ATP-binding protein [Methanocalculus chunghsingensis]MBR1368352.1 ATPase (AAA+ superfamily) [Methanocalculus chunghsingensis]